MTGAENVFKIVEEATEDLDVAPAGSEEALALRFAELHFENLRFVADWNRWLGFDGTRWNFDKTRETWSLARKLCRDVAAGMNKPREGKAIASAKTRAAVVSLASEDRKIAASVDQWDADPWLLNTPSGTIDLKTGKRRDHSPDDYITKLTAVAPDHTLPTPIWDGYLDKVTANDAELKAYLARVCGYGLTGLIDEHAMFFHYGDGGNGKGVLTRTLIGIANDYARTAPIETFTDTKTDRHPTELAALRGARIVVATETEEGRNWAEAKIKMLTGGDPISARFMRQDFFDYTPQFKLMISGNHKPSLRSVDEAIKRRMNLIPWNVVIREEERDLHLSEKLKAEWPGILAWMIAGCAQWRELGLAPPKAVTQATEQYLQAEDSIALWLDECCAVKPDEWESMSALFKRWEEWATAHGEQGGSAKRFSQRLEAKKFVRQTRNNQRGFVSLTLSKDREGGRKDRIWSGPPLIPRPPSTRE